MSWPLNSLKHISYIRLIDKGIEIKRLDVSQQEIIYSFVKLKVE